jgi:hypothetical protein
MDKNSRDTQFQGFAKLLWDELVSANGGGYIDVNTDFDDGIDPTNYRGIITRRAYDLAFHAALRIDEKDCDVLGFEKAVRNIPDITEWPQESTE